MEVLAESDGPDILNTLEIDLIQKYGCCDPQIGYNMTLGGEGIDSNLISITKETNPGRNSGMRAHLKTCTLREVR